MSGERLTRDELDTIEAIGTLVEYGLVETKQDGNGELVVSLTETGRAIAQERKNLRPLGPSRRERRRKKRGG